MWDAVIIGGGAAGLFCAIEAGKRGRKVLVLEHNDRIGKKIAISGGGRCNFTNVHTTSENFISANPHFCKSALARYTPSDFIALVEKHGIAYHEKKLGQLFCDGSSQEIINLLLRECGDAGVGIRCDTKVTDVLKDPETGAFALKTNRDAFRTSALVIASGGLSIAPLGATDFGYNIARQFGLRIEEPRPALVPFTLNRQLLKQLAKLSGISVDALVALDGKAFRESVLVTHRGLSGPAILQISSYWRPGKPVSINLLPDENAFEFLQHHHSEDIELSNLLARRVPKRFAQAWCELYATSKPMKQYNERELAVIANQIEDFSIVPAGTEGFRKAEVTAGGISTDELSSQTMEARRVPGLYFIGEVVDVTGQLGGFNFQWAWASGFATGQAI